MIYEIKNLCFSYDGSTPVLSNLNMQVEEGALLTILGPNGSGKSTLFSCMLGLLKTGKNVIFLKGKELHEYKERELAGIVSYVPQNHEAVFGYKVFDYVLMGCASRTGLFSHPGNVDENCAIDALEALNITDLKDRLITELSGGQRQQAAIARALAARPGVILLDEPTAHLDYGNQMKVLSMIKDLHKQGYTILMTTHDPNHALMMGESTALLSADGKLEQGPCREMVTTENLKRIYGTGVDIQILPDGRPICVYPSI